MRISKPVLATAVALSFVGSAALAAAQQVQGKIVKVDKANHEITLQRGAPGQTVGSAAAPTEKFRLDHDPSFELIKAGDQVTLKVEEINGVRTITQVGK